jgi:hypothetical protein
MKKWWAAFDSVHAAQRPGMSPLWGLVDEGLALLPPAVGDPGGPSPGLYRALLPRGLSDQIDRLWDGVALKRWPERIVSEFHPHRQMAEAIGPAVRLWNGVALTSWYVCEGMFSRTPLGGLEEYHRRELAELSQAGFAVDSSLFEELTAAEALLGPPQELKAPGELFVSRHRRDGFEVLRDIVTRHRRNWAEANLDSYLGHRWESELREVAHEFSRRTAARGKPPTFKQFAGFAVSAANHWFGGDLTAVYAALGEPAPAQADRVDLLVGDPLEFAQAVWRGLGGRDLPNSRFGERHPDQERQWELRRLPHHALRYLQQFEALGRPPTLDEFGSDSVRWEHLGGQQVGWEQFTRTIESCRQG